MQNEIRRAVVLARGKVISEEDLEEGIEGRAAPQSSKTDPERSLVAAVSALEKRMIADALEANQQNQQQAAKALGLSRQGLINKIKRYGIVASAGPDASHS